MVAGSLMRMAGKRAAKRGMTSVKKGGVSGMMDRVQKGQNMMGQAQEMRGMMGGGAAAAGVAPTNVGMPMPANTGTGQAQAAGGNKIFLIGGAVLVIAMLAFLAFFNYKKNNKDFDETI